MSAGSSSTSRLEALLEAGERDELLRVLMPGQRHAAMDTATDLFLGEVLSLVSAA